MKRYLRSSNLTDSSISLKIEAAVIFGYEYDIEEPLAASKGYAPNSVPRSSLPHVEIGSSLGPQALADYNSFIRSVEELIEDYYDLDVYYTNTSPDESHYYACLAKDSSGSLILDFKVKIRIATHPAHESSQADYNKRKEKDATRVIANGKKLKPLYIQLICNDTNEEVSTYDEAYLWIDEQIDKKVSIMKRRLKYKKGN